MCSCDFCWLCCKVQTNPRPLRLFFYREKRLCYFDPQNVLNCRLNKLTRGHSSPRCIRQRPPPPVFVCGAEPAWRWSREHQGGSGRRRSWRSEAPPPLLGVCALQPMGCRTLEQCSSDGAESLLLLLKLVTSFLLQGQIWSFLTCDFLLGLSANLLCCVTDLFLLLGDKQQNKFLKIYKTELVSEHFHCGWSLFPQEPSQEHDNHQEHSGGWSHSCWRPPWTGNFIY